MVGDIPADRYFIWGIDESPYGPVPLTALADWVADERVAPETWVFSRNANHWLKAGEMPELKDFFGMEVDLAAPAAVRNTFAPGSLRRIKILAELNDAQLAHLAEFLEPMEVKQHSRIISQGDTGDAMYLIMGGEVRARMIIGGRETILTTLAIGDFFGEMALFDHGPRSADVVANVDSLLLRLSSASFQRLTREAPSLATPFLQATARTLSARIRNDNKRLARVTQQYTAGSEL
jgi:CRP-like cAMP-binding protein